MPDSPDNNLSFGLLFPDTRSTYDLLIGEPHRRAATIGALGGCSQSYPMPVANPRELRPHFAYQIRMSHRLLGRQADRSDTIRLTRAPDCTASVRLCDATARDKAFWRVMPCSSRCLAKFIPIRHVNTRRPPSSIHEQVRSPWPSRFPKTYHTFSEPQTAFLWIGQEPRAARLT